MNKKPMQLLIATTNKGKIVELKNLLADLPIELKNLNDYSNLPEAAETGKTFAENAALKARAYAQQTNCWTLADDSGLEVSVLNEAPGVFSARYAGEKASDAANIEKLLHEIKKTGEQNPSARFVCAMAISDDTGEIIFATEGFCSGSITGEQRGANGFGYDPIFVPEGFRETFAELSTATKQQISHRGRAAAKIIQYLRDFVIV